MFVDCLLCSSQTVLWGRKESYRILKCIRCGFGFVYPRPRPLDLNTFYYTRRDEGFQPSPKMMRYRKEIPACQNAQLIESRLRRLGCFHGRERHSLLDVGAGFGGISSYFSLRGWRVFAVEPSPLCIRDLEKLKGVHVIASTFEEWEAEGLLFDVIVMSQVLEHVLDPASFLRKSAQLLKPGGVLFVSVPNFNSLLVRILKTKEGHICPPEHLNYFTPKSILQIALVSGLSVSAVFTSNMLTRSLAIEGWKEYVQIALLQKMPLSIVFGSFSWYMLELASAFGQGRYIFTFLKK